MSHQSIHYYYAICMSVIYKIKNPIILFSLYIRGPQMMDVSNEINNITKSEVTFVLLLYYINRT